MSPLDDEFSETPDLPVSTAGNVAVPDILVFEHDPSTRELILSTLVDAGLAAASALPAGPGSDAVKILVVDLGLPKSAGVSSLASLRALFRRARVVAISGRFDFNAGAAPAVARQLGADRVLAKPLDCRALLVHVRQLLGERRP